MKLSQRLNAPMLTIEFRLVHFQSLNSKRTSYSQIAVWEFCQLDIWGLKAGCLAIIQYLSDWFV